ncbi:MAG: hypothetical protein IJA20_10585 [Methanocorpusculum sp.]|nr:hypothetical protein [Methanocorpusculum sp.]
MRREVLYQYDLPMEILDDISADEEVLNVLFGRSKDKYLIPILFSRKRILWGYPETQTVYKVFTLQYVDVLSIFAKFPPAVSATLVFHTALGKDIVFPHIQDPVDDVRSALLSAAESIRTLSSRHFSLSQRKNLLTDEYLLHENPDVPVFAADEDIFEDAVLQTPDPTPAPAEIEDDLFARFSSAGEDDVFEAAEDTSDTHAAAVDERVARMIQSTELPSETKAPLPPENDAVIYEPVSLSRNEQWNGEGGGDAEILPRGSPWKNAPKAPVSPVREVFSPEDDDSEVYSAGERPKLIVPQPKAAPAQETEVEIIEKVTVLPNPSVKPRAKKAEVSEAPAEPAPEPVMIFRRQKNPEAVTLQPKEGIDEETVDKSLEALKFLRENKIISEAEYKKRCLSLFEKEE